MTNRFHVFVADRLEQTGSTSFDENEILDGLLVPADEVRSAMGRPPYSHALMVAALYLSDRFRSEEEGRHLTELNHRPND